LQAADQLLIGGFFFFDIYLVFCTLAGSRFGGYFPLFCPCRQRRVEVNGGYIVGNTAVTDGQWHHVACTWQDDGSPNVTDVRLYVDGEFDGNSSKQGKAINTEGWRELTVGKDHSNRTVNGFIDEFMLFGRALNDNDIKGIYQMGMP